MSSQPSSAPTHPNVAPNMTLKPKEQLSPHRRTVDIVLARYMESLHHLINCIPHLAQKYKITLWVYNKHYRDASVDQHVYDQLIPYIESIRTSNLDNVGRESHTYLTHIINNYDSLADATVFLQAEFDDVFTIHRRLQGTYYTHILSMIQQALHQGIFHYTRWPINYFKNLIVDRMQKGVPIVDWTTGDNSIRRYMKERLDWDLMHPNNPSMLLMHYYGLQAASRDSIRERSLESYNLLLEDTNVHCNNLCGHYLERLWIYILKQSFIPRSCMTK